MGMILRLPRLLAPMEMDVPNVTFSVNTAEPWLPVSSTHSQVWLGASADPRFPDACGGGDLRDLVNVEPDRLRDGIDDARGGEFPGVEPGERARVRGFEIEDHPGVRGARGRDPGIAHQNGDIVGAENHDPLHLRRSVGERKIVIQPPGEDGPVDLRPGDCASFDIVLPAAAEFGDPHVADRAHLQGYAERRFSQRRGRNAGGHVTVPRRIRDQSRVVQVHCGGVFEQNRHSGPIVVAQGNAERVVPVFLNQQGIHIDLGGGGMRGRRGLGGPATRTARLDSHAGESFRHQETDRPMRPRGFEGADIRSGRKRRGSDDPIPARQTSGKNHRPFLAGKVQDADGYVAFGLVPVAKGSVIEGSAPIPRDPSAYAMPMSQPGKTVRRYR